MYCSSTLGTSTSYHISGSDLRHNVATHPDGGHALYCEQCSDHIDRSAGDITLFDSSGNDSVSCSGCSESCCYRGSPYGAACNCDFGWTGAWCLRRGACVGNCAWFVSPSGIDAAGRGSAASPLKTLAAALLLVSTGETIILQPGVYSNCDLEGWTLAAAMNITITGGVMGDVIVDCEGAGRFLNVDLAGANVIVESIILQRCFTYFVSGVLRGC